MNTISALVKNYKLSALLYGIVGLLSAVVEWATFYAASLRVDLIYATLIAFVVATLFNHLLSRQTVFVSKRNGTEELGLVFLVSALAFAGNFAVFQVLRLSLGVNIMISKVCGTAIGFASNFMLRQFYVFSTKSRFQISDKPLSGTPRSDRSIVLERRPTKTRQVQ